MSEPLAPLPQRGTTLSPYERQYLTLLDTQDRHRNQLQADDCVILPYAANIVDLPVTDNLHICVFRGIRQVEGLREEVGGIRFKDRSTTTGKRLYVPVYSLKGTGPLETLDDFSENHAFVVAEMVAELALRDGIDFYLRPDLTELMAPIDTGY